MEHTQFLFGDLASDTIAMVWALRWVIAAVVVLTVVAAVLDRTWVDS